MVEYAHLPGGPGGGAQVIPPLPAALLNPDVFRIDDTFRRGPALPRRTGGEPDRRDTFLVAGHIRRTFLQTAWGDDPRIVAFHANPRREAGKPPGEICGAPTSELPPLFSEAVGLAALHNAGWQGQGVLLIVADEPLNAAFIEKSRRGVVFRADYGWKPDSWTAGAGKVVSHGTMVAFVATKIAPKVTLAEIASFPTGKALLHNIQAAFTKLGNDITGNLLRDVNNEPFKAIVVTNSWSANENGPPFTEDGDCEGWENPPQASYGTNSPCHVVNRTIKLLESRNVDIVFAAGNNGVCATATAGRGSIAGANSLQQVLTVGAVTLGGRRLSDSSQGGGVPQLGEAKPDISTVGRFTEAQPILQPNRTSAAAALAAGLVAAVRSKCGSSMSPKQLRAYLTAPSNVGVNAFRADGTSATVSGQDRDFGRGLLAGAKLVAAACKL